MIFHLKKFFCKKYYILTNWRCWSQSRQYFPCNVWSSFYLHEALHEFKFTSWKTKLLPNISKLRCCNRIFRFLYLNRKTISSKEFSYFLRLLFAFSKIYLMTVKLPKVRNNLLEEMNHEWDCTVSKNTCFQQIFMETEQED